MYTFSHTLPLSSKMVCLGAASLMTYNPSARTLHTSLFEIQSLCPRINFLKIKANLRQMATTTTKHCMVTWLINTCLSISFIMTLFNFLGSMHSFVSWFHKNVQILKDFLYTTIMSFFQSLLLFFLVYSYTFCKTKWSALCHASTSIF